MYNRKIEQSVLNVIGCPAGTLNLASKTQFLVLIILLFRFSHLMAESVDEKPIVVIIPSYNNINWYGPNLDSVLRQNYKNLRVIYFDDASTDGTGDLVREHLKENDPEHKVIMIQNQTRVGALANIYRGVWMCQPSEVVVTVDGDDWLPHENVLQLLNRVYSESDVWMTYGQFVEYPTGRWGEAAQVPYEIIMRNRFREYDWVTTHLRTFYAGLFQKIKTEDLFHEGAFFPVTWDLAFMYPMLEMAGFHSRFINEPVYVYNVVTPLADRKLHLELQQFFYTYIRQNTPYQQIDVLFDSDTRKNAAGLHCDSNM